MRHALLPVVCLSTLICGPFAAAQDAAKKQARTAQAWTLDEALAQLEQHLGVRLFHRTTRNMALTDEGRQFLDNVRPALGWLHRAIDTVREAKDEIAGPLRIVGPRSAFRPASDSVTPWRA